MLTLTKFIEKANNIHNNFYDYSKVDFKSTKEKIIVICPIHGEFSQRVSVHINDKCGCPTCGKLKRHRINFKKEAIAVHGDTYDYTLVDFKRSHDDVEIICRKHGIFLQRPDAHIHQKQGCPICGLENRILPNKKTTEEFIKSASLKWGNKYDYTSTIYINKKTKIKYRCKVHGEVEQYPSRHIKNGCNYCSGRGISRHNKISFINVANVIHGGKYDYSKVTLTRITDYVTIICNKHGEFIQRANNHIHLCNGCPKCISNVSKEEIEVLKFIKSNYSGVVLGNEKILDCKDIDVYLPDLKLGFEYHGLYWHIELVRGRNLHYDKWKIATEKGIRLIQIYSSEWKEKPEIIKSKIMNLLGKSKRIFARKTSLVQLSKAETEDFLSKNHLQGNCIFKVSYGLIYDGEIVSCMVFSRSRLNKKYKYELLRFCNKNFHNVVGGASRLLKRFKSEHVGSIISYADKRYSDGGLYKKLGFVLDAESKPSCSFVKIKDGTIHNRMAFMKYKLLNIEGINLGDLKDPFVYEIVQLNGYDRIWDAGQYRFVMN